ncbi:MAG: leucine-rich repeat protein [Clostridia bacterium]|nr:leucine-rich repeat protein [Clostridia bacterium]
MKRIVSLLLTIVLLVSTIAMPVSAVVENAVSSSNEDNPISIEITTDKSKYGTLGTANIAVKVTNIGTETLENISAEALFTNMIPVGKNSKITAETDKLNANESLTFHYQAMLNPASSQIQNFFQGILLLIKSLFAHKVKIVDNHFDDGRDSTQHTVSVKYGMYNAGNTIYVWYGKSTEIDTDTYAKWYADVDESHVVTTETGYSYENNRILVSFWDATEQQKQDVVRSVNGIVLGKDEWDSEYQIQIPTTNSFDEMKEICNRVRKMNGVLWCSEEFMVTTSPTSTIPNDPWEDTFQGFWGVDWNEDKPDGLNWWTEAIQLPSAWDYNNRFSKIKIGVCDSGFDTEHEDLSIHVIGNNNQLVDHGTHVSGVVGATANNEKGITGIVWNKELFCSIAPQGKINILDMLNPIETLLKKGCKVINYSQGSTITNQETIFQHGAYTAQRILRWDKHLKKDFIIVKSAGNDGLDSLSSGTFASVTDESIEYMFKVPENEEFKKTYNALDVYEHFIIVGATGKPSSKGEYSIATKKDFNFGSNYGTYVSIAAPGTDIFSTTCMGGTDGNYDNMSGTSMAAPIVTGVTSLVWSVNPQFTAEEVKEIVISSVDKYAKGNGTDNILYPIVNAKLAVEEAIRRTDNSRVQTISGAVVDSTTNQPIPNVNISCERLNINCKTDENGKFGFNLTFPLSQSEFIFSHEDYQDYKVTINGSSHLDTIFGEVKLTKIGRIIVGVQDSTTNLPIENVLVEITDLESGRTGIIATAKTNSDGYFNIQLPFGRYNFTLTHDNYKSYSFTETLNVDILYNFDPVLLNPKDDFTIPTGNPTDSGTCGDTATWQYYKTSETLVISGSGDMYDYSSTNHSPWYKYIYNIEKIFVTDNITKIGNDSFSGCDIVTSVNIGKNVNSIGNRAFYACWKLDYIVIPNRVSKLGNHCFADCKELRSITIPNSVTSVGAYAFLYCYKLTAINVDEQNTQYSSDRYGVLYNKSKTELIQYPTGNERVSFTIPNGIENIDAMAFSSCSYLESITIPSSMTIIPYASFANCYTLKTITIPKSVTIIDEHAFDCCHKLNSITFSDSVISIGRCAFSNCEALKDVYYGGTESQWKKIDILDENSYLISSTIHYNSYNSIFQYGDGSVKKPYQISTPEQLNAIRNDLSAHYIQTADIDMSAWGSWEPIGDSYSYVENSEIGNVESIENPFMGSFNGNDFQISNLTITESSGYVSVNEYYGLFRLVDNGTLKNIHLENINYFVDKSLMNYSDFWNQHELTCSLAVGGIAGWSNTSIQNCSVSGTISINHCDYATVGGIAGQAKATNCINRATIYINADNSGTTYGSSVTCGGIIGENFGGISKCSNYGNIEAHAIDAIFLGGICGEFDNIEDCVNYGNLKGYVSNGHGSYHLGKNCNVGGIVSMTYGNVLRCVNYGEVSAYSNYIQSHLDTETGSLAGGIAGYCGYYDSGKIYNCVNLSANINSYTHDKAGNVVKDNAGRIAGYSISIKDCYSASSTLINGFTQNGTSIDKNGQSITAEQLKQMKYYVGFDFDTIWKFDPTIGYPVLR